MNDSELISLIKKIGFTLLLLIIGIILMITMYRNKFQLKESNIIKKINNNDTFLILITDNKCSNCIEIKNILDEKNIDYIKISNNNEIKKVKDKLIIEEKDIEIPSLLIVSEKELKVSLVNPNNEELYLFLDNYFGSLEGE